MSGPDLSLFFAFVFICVGIAIGAALFIPKGPYDE